MARDFRSDRIRINKVVTSASYDGSDRLWPGVSFYSASAADGFSGLISDTNMLNDVGTDVGFFVSGSKDSRELKTWGGVSLFGGDVVVSGTLYAEKQVIEVDESVTGSLSVSGSLFVSGSARIGVYGTGSFTPSFNDVALLVTADSRHNAGLQRHTASILIHEQGDNDGGRLLFTNEVDDKGEHGVSHAWHIYGKPAAEGSNFDASMNFYYNDGENDGTGANFVRITGDGKVAVGMKVVYPHAEFEVQNVNAAYGGGTSTILISADSASSASLAFRKEVTNDPAAAISLTADNNLSISMLNDDGQDKDIIFNVNVEGTPTEVMRILGLEAYVGIGIDAPTANLHVADTGATTILIDGDNTGDARLMIENGGGNHYLFDDQSDSNHLKLQSANELAFNTDGATERMRIDDSGNVGIGTDGPVFKLQIEDDGAASVAIRELDNASNGPDLKFQKSNASAIVADNDDLGNIQFYGHDGTDYATMGCGISGRVDGTPAENDMPGELEFYTREPNAGSATNRMKIRSDGKIGIGTDEPATLLQVSGCISATTATGDTGYALHTKKNGGSSARQIAIENLDAAATDAPIWGIHHQDGGNLSIGELWNDYKFVIDPDGKIGIGTIEPEMLLAVSGTIGARTVYSETADSLHLRREGNYSARMIELENIDAAATSMPTWKILHQDTGDFALGADYGSPLFTIDESGNVGIGDDSPDHTLDVEGNIGIAAGGYLNWDDTDGTSGYGFFDNAGTLQFKNSGGSWTDIGAGTDPGGSTTEIQFNNAGVFDGDASLVWNAGAQGLEINGAILLASDIMHMGDPDTKISFDTDKIEISAGGWEAVDITEALINTTTFNPDQVSGFSWQVATAGNTLALKIAGLSNRVEVMSENSTDNDGDDVLFFVSGSTTHLHPQDQGRSLFAGDMTVSGSLKTGGVASTIYRTTTLINGSVTWDDGTEPVSTRIIADGTFNNPNVQVYDLPTGIEHNGRTITIKMMDIGSGMVKLDPGASDQIEDPTAQGTMLLTADEAEFQTGETPYAWTYQAFWVTTTQKMLWFIVGKSS